MVINNDSLMALKEIEDNSIDSVITDPPYGYSFMGKDWDRAVPSVDIWRECLRVLKPGGWCMVMSAPRSDVQNAMISRLIEAGFRLDFTPIYWSFASGFPKAMNLERKLSKDAENQKAQVRELWRTVFSESQRVEEEHDRWNLSELLEDLEQGEQCQVTSESITRQEVQIPERQLQSFLERWSDLSQAQRELHQCEVCSLPTGVLINGKRRWLCYGTQASDGSVYWTAIDEDGMCTSSQSRPLGQSARQPDAVCDECRTQKVRALTGGYGGFQPKPAVEVVLVAMKPLSEKTYVDQALKNGKGITWLDDCRVPTGESLSGGSGRIGGFAGKEDEGNKGLSDYRVQGNEAGRFPANLLVSDDVLNDGRVEVSKKGKPRLSSTANVTTEYGGGQHNAEYADSGSYSRYFDLDKWAAAHLSEQQMKTFPFAIFPKASKSEKNKGLENRVADNAFAERKTAQCATCGNKGFRPGVGKTFTCGHTTIEYVTTQYQQRGNNHPTVKPLRLMSYLITLTTREGDTVLDPFVGSGTTVVAAKQLNRIGIGIEREAEYAEIAQARVEAAEKVEAEDDKQLQII